MMNNLYIKKEFLFYSSSTWNSARLNINIKYNTHVKCSVVQTILHDILRGCERVNTIFINSYTKGLCARCAMRVSHLFVTKFVRNVDPCYAIIPLFIQINIFHIKFLTKWEKIHKRCMKLFLNAKIIMMTYCGVYVYLEIKC